ncbi:MFS transporter, DHA2 family, multidrug resistance protein [Enhydrobacter aerosaccus]|uniref:MFS transporter, DHA2 family, multidrug resistance protein n=1 Tax=Enhydrobacter aerosaccus TaxID=225324 RepID=A0A1T4N5L0_9HYPH|nr:MFS transporter [Enhydrobacter aerosaccus]SJZ74464.1 MFS transporter, DHA2 family, multidrug resistance protein [Enhydrobacter aerosaccus]
MPYSTSVAEPVPATATHPDGLPPGLPRILAVATITIGLSMAVLSNSMTNLALPYIAHDLDISAESSIWIVNASQIAQMVSLLPLAALGDIIGYRRVYRAGILLFCIASVGCVLAPSLPWLLAARTFQGLGAAGLMAIQPALVRSIYPRNMLGRGLGFNTTVVATSLAAGPSIGAALLAVWSWPILFACYIPLGIVSFILGERYLPRTVHIRRPFDILSAVLSGATFGLLIFAIDGLAHGHSWNVILAEAGGAAVLGTLFIWRQKLLVHPMMPVDIFRRPIFALSISTSSCTFVAQGLAYVSLPFFFHTVLGRSATDTGILLTAWPLALAAIAPFAGRLADRYHAGVLGAIGLASMTTGLVLTALLPDNPSTANVMWRLMLCGAGFGIFASPNNRLMMNAVPRDRSGSAGGIIATSRTLGQTLGAALVALMFGLFDFSAGGAQAYAAAHGALWLGAAFAGTALVIGSFRMRLQR